IPNRSPPPACCFPTGRYESRAPVTLGLVIFAATYVLIAVQRLPFVHLNRPAASLLGAVAMVGFGVLPLVDAYAAIDFDVLVFLLGLMLIVGYLEVGKFFEFSAEWILQRARTPERLLFGVVVGGGLLSALFVNDTICLVRSEEHTSELQSLAYLVCRLLLEKKKNSSINDCHCLM